MFSKFLSKARRRTIEHQENSLPSKSCNTRSQANNTRVASLLVRSHHIRQKSPLTKVFMLIESERPRCLKPSRLRSLPCHSNRRTLVRGPVWNALPDPVWMQFGILDAAAMNCPILWVSKALEGALVAIEEHRALVIWMKRRRDK